MNAHERMTDSHTMHYCSRAFIEGYASAPKYTPHSESSQGNFWVFHPRDLSPFLIRLTRAFTFHHYFIFFPFNTFFTIFIISSHNHDEEHPEVLPALFMDPQE